jgi:integrase
MGEEALEVHQPGPPVRLTPELEHAAATVARRPDADGPGLGVEADLDGLDVLAQHATAASVRTNWPVSRTVSRGVVAELRSASGESEWVFPSPKRHGHPIAHVQKAAERLVKLSGVDFVPHDLRRTAASHMTSIGIPRLVVSKLLNHVEQGVTAVYDRHSYDSEKQDAATRWGYHLDRILSAE